MKREERIEMKDKKYIRRKMTEEEEGNEGGKRGEYRK